jgi:hypothetical protein
MLNPGQSVTFTRYGATLRGEVVSCRKGSSVAIVRYTDATGRKWRTWLHLASLTPSEN